MRRIFFVLFFLLIILLIFYFFVFKNENKKSFLNLGRNLEKDEKTSLDLIKEKENFFTLNDVSLNNSKQSCYTIIQGEVFDLTSWISKHPGGEEFILNMCGKEATEMFLKKHQGQEIPEKVLKQYKIGLFKNE